MPKRAKSAEDQKKKAEQTNFEEAVKKLRNKYAKSGIIKSSAHFNYGKDPQKKNSNLGRRKVLHRLCGTDINNCDELKDYIDATIKFNYCILAKAKRCYDMTEYKFEMQNSFNLSEQLLKSLTTYSNSLPKVFEDAMIAHLVTSKHKDCILKVDNMQFYVRTITQDVLSADMEPRKNAHRVSYGPIAVIEINKDVIMRLKCDRIGVGYYDIINHKVNKQSNKKCSSHGCIHKVINIHQDFLKDVYIDFGIRHNYSKTISVDIIHNKLADKYGGAVSLINIIKSNNCISYGGNHNGLNSVSCINFRYNPLFGIQ